MSKFKVGDIVMCHDRTVIDKITEVTPEGYYSIMLWTKSDIFTAEEMAIEIFDNIKYVYEGRLALRAEIAIYV